MTLKEQFLLLPPAEKRRVHFALCAKALAVWLSYASQKKKSRYVDGVVGLSHKVDMALPSDAFNAAQEGRDAAGVAERYAEPITAMQDDDLEFPRNIEFAYYSIYNLFCKYVTRDDIDDWIIVNQAISSEPDEPKMFSILSETLKPLIEPDAAPNGGPATRFGGSGVAEGPPSVS